MSKSLSMVGPVLLSIAAAVSTVPGSGESCDESSDCAAGEYCKWPTGICLAEQPLGSCEVRPEVCTTEWVPVCSCSFWTYPNACEASRAGASLLYEGACDEYPCGGYLELACNEGEHCNVDAGSCEIYFGSCEPGPGECDETCEPVCGCDGMSYANTCLAQMAGWSALHDGECDTATDRVISGVSFETVDTLVWQPEQGAMRYNVYREILATPTAPLTGSCYLDGIPQTSTAVAENPLPGETWLLQVTAVFDDGEGPMGMGSDCRVRIPEQGCPSAVASGECGNTRRSDAGICL